MVCKYYQRTSHKLLNAFSEKYSVRILEKLKWQLPDLKILVIAVFDL